MSDLSNRITMPLNWFIRAAIIAGSVTLGIVFALIMLHGAGGSGTDGLQPKAAGHNPAAPPGIVPMSVTTPPEKFMPVIANPLSPHDGTVLHFHIPDPDAPLVVPAGGTVWGALKQSYWCFNLEATGTTLDGLVARDLQTLRWQHPETDWDTVPAGFTFVRPTG